MWYSRPDYSSTMNTVRSVLLALLSTCFGAAVGSIGHIYLTIFLKRFLSPPLTVPFQPGAYALDFVSLGLGGAAIGCGAFLLLISELSQRRLVAISGAIVFLLFFKLCINPVDFNSTVFVSAIIAFSAILIVSWVFTLCCKAQSPSLH